MYVLDTETGRLHYFPKPEAVPGGYAILSHVWESEKDGGEQTFKDVQKIAKQCDKDGTIPHESGHLSKKIRESCKLAKSDGYRWIWNDTCCIDKRSSSELSEAINSMYRYYSLAEVCYTYLRDVPSNDDPLEKTSAFRKSRWHKRGWTLQELIAPTSLVFVSQDWTILDGRTELADVLQDITRIPVDLLMLVTTVDDYSVAQRMSWAARRETTREEDRAYSLMGIFGIHMPTLYGEGWNAFRRLQEEIMRESVDPSLFLWGEIKSMPPLRMRKAKSTCITSDSDPDRLLATSPDAFYHSAGIKFLPSRFGATSATPASETEKPKLANSWSTNASSYATELRGRLPSFALTPYAVHAHVPVIRGYRGLLFALMPCFEGESPLGLILSPCRDPSDPSRPLYHTQTILEFTDWRLQVFAHVVTFDIQSLPVRSWYTPWNTAVVTWKDVYITPWPRSLRQTRRQQQIPPLINTMLSSPFRFSEESLRNLRGWGHLLHPIPMPLTSLRWTGASPHIAVVFQHRWSTVEFVAIFLGICRSDGQLGQHWAAIKFYTSQDHAQGPKFSGHACPGDHICLWPDSKKFFKDEYSCWDWGWGLSFTPSPSNRDIPTLVANIERR